MARINLRHRVVMTKEGEKYANNSIRIEMNERMTLDHK